MAYRLLNVRDVFGPVIRDAISQVGRDPDAPEWRDYLPATLHYLTFMAYARRKDLEYEAAERQMEHRSKKERMAVLQDRYEHHIY